MLLEPQSSQAGDAFPPLNLWPEHVLEHEPAHYLFVRFAEVNRQISCRTLATSFGINGLNLKPDEFVDFCDRFPTVTDAQSLIAETPLIDGNIVTLRGGTFSVSKDFSLGRPRVCGACLGESRHYRNWFDIAAISRCPIHDRPLIDGNGRSKLAWWFPRVGVTPAGEDLIEHEVARPPLNDSWDRYVLGRLSIVDGLSCPMLDPHPLHSVIAAVEFVGRVSVAEGGALGPRLLKRTERRAHALEAGFAAFLAGPEGVLETLRAPPSGYHLSVMHAKSLTREFGPRGPGLNYYDHIKDVARLAAQTDLSRYLVGCVDELQRESHIISRKRRPPVESLAGAPLTLNELARVVRINAPKLRSIAVKLGLTEPSVSRQSRHYFDKAKVEALRAALQRALPRAEAANSIGMSLSEFDRRVEQTGIAPLARLRGTGRASDLFLPEQLFSLLD